jgi:hypothetical protein
LVSAGLQPTTTAKGHRTPAGGRYDGRRGSSEGSDPPLALPSLDTYRNNSARCERVRLLNRSTGEIVGVRCRSWKCPVCSVSNRRAFSKRLRLGLTGALADSSSPLPKLLTLTSRASENPAESRRLLSRRFASVRRHLERVFPGCQVEYAGAVELTQRGAVHFHVVLRGVPYLPQAVWSRVVSRYGFGPVVDIRRVQSGELGRYLSKSLGTYLTKSSGVDWWPPHFRRVRFSRSWAPEWVLRPARAATEAPSEWSMRAFLRVDDPLAFSEPEWIAGQGPP